MERNIYRAPGVFIISRYMHSLELLSNQVCCLPSKVLTLTGNVDNGKLSRYR